MTDGQDLLTNLDPWSIRRGARGRPTLWCCSGCSYSYWSHDDDQDPDGDGHCSGGIWLADGEALAVIGRADA